MYLELLLSVVAVKDGKHKAEDKRGRENDAASIIENIEYGLESGLRLGMCEPKQEGDGHGDQSHRGADRPTPQKKVPSQSIRHEADRPGEHDGAKHAK